jgi:hypothetical protein
MSCLGNLADVFTAYESTKLLGKRCRFCFCLGQPVKRIRSTNLLFDNEF